MAYPILENLCDVDPEIDRLIKYEEQRQASKIILVASECICPKPVREALSTIFGNLYAEGLPPISLTRDPEEELLDFEYRLARFKRYHDRRYYKGCEFVDLVEGLAQRRCAKIFATKEVPQSKIFANVQPLSGAAANNSVYNAFLKPGDIILSMTLTGGGHLTHGSPVNRSGQLYRIVHYYPDEKTGKIDYNQVRDLAKQHRPKLILAGYSAYPWSVDWKKFREIADEVGAILMADIAHPAGLVVAGLFPTPVGYADVITFTTHKTLCGPRGAVILTTNPEKAKIVDRGVFPAEQGGPHIHQIAAKAVCFQIAKTPQFHQLQKLIYDNCQILCEELKKNDIPIAYGGTDSHMLLINLRPLTKPDEPRLSAEIASRILDLCGITTNKNTMLGDVSPVHPSAVRLGTTWVSQLGMGEQEMKEIADIVAKILKNIKTFTYIGRGVNIPRAKIKPEIVAEANRRVKNIMQNYIQKVLPETPEEKIYQTPLANIHRKYNALMVESNGWLVPKNYGDVKEEINFYKTSAAMLDLSDCGILKIRGPRAYAFLSDVCSSNIYDLKQKQACLTVLLDKEANVIDDVIIYCLKEDPPEFLLLSNPENAQNVQRWLGDLSDGYIMFEEDDIFIKTQGPVVIENLHHKNIIIRLTGHRAEEIASKLKDGFCIHINDSCKFFDFCVDFQEAERFSQQILSKFSYIHLGGLDLRQYIRKQAGLPIYTQQAKVDSTWFMQNGFSHLFDWKKTYYIGQIKITDNRKTCQKIEFKWQEKQKPPLTTWLYEEHLKLTHKRNFITFAGWKMPLQYTSMVDEHHAVRKSAGLFDVSHMGVIEVAGKDANRFLNITTTGYTLRLKDRQAQYCYVLDIDGMPMDDIIVYKRKKDKFLIVANAINQDKIFEWFKAVASKKYLISRENPQKEFDGEVIIRNLKDETSAKDMLIDIALQGKNSLKVLLNFTLDEKDRKSLLELGRFELIETVLKNVDGKAIEVIVARTGYTGERIGYEIFVHPDNAPRLWRSILKEGKKYGVKPAGLGARDSTRIEAGLPLYGHELAGPYKITPSEAACGYFVKLHKPFFIGRYPTIKMEANREREIVRFEMTKWKRVIWHADPVVDQHGFCVGFVTSASVINGRQIGMAIVDRKFTKVETQIGIIPLPRAKKVEEKTKVKLLPGDKVILHQEAVVIPRFASPDEIARRFSS
jgi:glycine cleavage system T protein